MHAELDGEIKYIKPISVWQRVLERSTIFCPHCELPTLLEEQVNIDNVQEIRITCDRCTSVLFEITPSHSPGLCVGRPISEEVFQYNRLIGSESKEYIIGLLKNIMTDDEIEEIEREIRKL